VTKNLSEFGKLATTAIAALTHSVARVVEMSFTQFVISLINALKVETQ